MASIIRVPSPLRRFTDNQAQVEVDRATVGEALMQLCERYPQLRNQLLDEHQQLRHFVNIYLNQEDIRSHNGLDTPLPEGAELRIVPAIAGGNVEQGGRVNAAEESFSRAAEGPFTRSIAGSSQLPGLSAAEMARYSRHIMLPELGKRGQQRLKAARVLIIGAGGLGSPLSLYLAAAGVGTLGLVDHDRVEESNLQRQILFGVEDIGTLKVEAAARRLNSLNPNVEYNTYPLQFSADNALALIRDYDLVIDGTDNFPTRYLVNDACVMLGKPNIYGSIFRFDGQATVFGYQQGPCYRCLYPQPPPPGLVPSCAEGGVMGVLPAMIATVQATEAIKILAGIGSCLNGRLLIYDALTMSFEELRIRRDRHCCVCGDQPTLTELIDYQQFCGIAASPTAGDIEEISAVMLKRMLEQGERFQLLDVREPYEREICRIEGSLHVPMQELEQRIDELDPELRIVVHCKLGGRSAEVCRQLQQRGFRQPINLKGGILAWIDGVDETLTRY